MRSVFIGLALLLLWGPLSPLTMLWLLGEKFQHRTPSWWHDTDGLPSNAAMGLVFSACLMPFFWALVLLAAR